MAKIRDVQPASLSAGVSTYWEWITLSFLIEAVGHHGPEGTVSFPHTTDPVGELVEPPCALGPEQCRRELAEPQPLR
jgi:hypothetical protein